MIYCSSVNAKGFAEADIAKGPPRPSRNSTMLPKSNFSSLVAWNLKTSRGVCEGMS